MVEQRLEIRPGTPIIGADDETLGHVERVVVTPATGDVLALIARRGLLLRRDLVVPIEAVESADTEAVRVRLTSAQVNELPEYREEEFTAPPADWQAPAGQAAEGVLFRLPARAVRRGLRAARAGQTEAAAGGRPLRAGMRVESPDGEVGSLDLVLLDPATHRATHFVVRAGGLLGRDTIIPVEWVRSIESDRVVLAVGREQLERLPEYRPDEEISADVLHQLWYRSDLPEDDLRFVGVQTHDGVVHLSGITTTAQSRAKIEAAARRVRGVLGVRNDLQTFEALAAASETAARSR